MKRLLCALLVIALLSTFCVPALASGNEQVPASRGTPQISEDPRYYAVYEDGTRIVAAYRPGPGGPVLISKEEFAAQLRSTEKRPEQAGGKKTEPVLQGYYQYYYRYQEWDSSEGFETLFRRRASDYVYNQTANEVLVQVPFAVTQSTYYSYTLTQEQKNAVSYEIHMDLDQTYSYSSSPYCRLDPHSRAWVEFWPSMHYTYGELQYCYSLPESPYLIITWSETLHIYIPTQVDGRLYGNYLVLESPI